VQIDSLYSTGHVASATSLCIPSTFFDLNYEERFRLKLSARQIYQSVRNDSSMMFSEPDKVKILVVSDIGDDTGSVNALAEHFVAQSPVIDCIICLGPFISDDAQGETIEETAILEGDMASIIGELIIYPYFLLLSMYFCSDPRADLLSCSVSSRSARPACEVSTAFARWTVSASSYTKLS
jgi:hypothetical protein